MRPIIDILLRTRAGHRAYLFLWRLLKNATGLKVFLYRLVWFLPRGMRRTSVLREALTDLADACPDVFVVEVGANDGVSGDPLREFIVTKRWQGILVEPVPYLCARLKRYYRNTPGLVFENAAIGKSSGSAAFWHLRESKDLPPGYDQLGSFSRSHVLKHGTMFGDVEQYLVQTDVPCLTLRDLVKKHGLTRVDVLLVDAEGHDAEIVLQLDELPANPRLLIFESIHMTEEMKADVYAFLNEHDYEILDAGGNSIAWWRGHSKETQVSPTGGQV